MTFVSSKESLHPLEKKREILRDNDAHFKDIKEFEVNDDPDYKKKVVQIKRVIKVIKGGKLLSYRTIVLTGGSYFGAGVGLGKSKELKIALMKAEAKSHQFYVNVSLNVNESIHYSSIAKYGASKMLLKPARRDTGIIAPGALRYLLKFIGIKNIVTKQLTNSNILNNLKASVLALKQIRNKAFFLSNFR